MSGEGSDPDSTATLEAELPSLLRRFDIGSMADVPCGDFAWMQRTDLAGVEYFGGDIVTDIIEHNTARYESGSVRFATCDLLTDDLPQVDLLLCRDCLVHFSYLHILQTMERIANSNVRYLLTTTFPELRANRDIITGEWRPLNMELPPFNFPPPIEMLAERPPERSFQDKSLGLWEIAQLSNMSFKG